MWKSGSIVRELHEREQLCRIIAELSHARVLYIATMLWTVLCTRSRTEFPWRR